ncbi:hypothetical protein G6011_10722 [Alternaria panax]|uniref:Thioredoxin-like fold domain-containing protein n=1 Tax=Alternaria panax TaxID=48097 RepID=A0AAD4IC74_9PLEO|nr:hypothetical protein G6011_10722 [Alternaria panax]
MDSNIEPSIIVHGANKPGHYTWSPFVTKLEFRLRLAHVPYRHGTGGPISGPKGKIPYVELSCPGAPSELLADTTLITKELVGRGLLSDMNARLAAKDVAFDLGIRALLEDKLFFYNARERWVDNYYTMRDYVLARLPFPQRTFFGYLAYRAILRKLQDQGTGRFSNEEIRHFRKDIWETLNGLLEDSRRSANDSNCFWVLGGHQPTEADAALFGFTLSSLVADAAPESKELVMTKCPAVLEYTARIHRCYFPDYRLWE